MPLLTHRFQAMGTVCEVQLYAPNRALAKRAVEQVLQDVERLEARYSRYRDSSFLSEINRVAASAGEIHVDEETALLLDYADTCYQQSDGLFDITSGLLRKAWNFKSGRLPEQAQLDALLSRIGWQKVVWDSPVLRFSRPGMEIDFGGIVKEYAVDRAATLCQQQGIQHGMINLGGDIRIIGPHPDGTPWRIGIQHPRNSRETLCTVELSEGALASSGDYERSLLIDGVRYGHILNPRTGWPVRHIAAVSVIADLCVLAGSVATIGMLRDEDAEEWLTELGGRCLWVTTAGEVGSLGFL
ncbi:MAG: FAD:protein FMN transferase [Pseudomonadales bacterium]|nr:FAD:protein FMN transferase [Pseudomonadales bacterium]MCP5359097.1 FAD:protein FMN transferase [Pseudomonadales bacterium]